MDDSADEEDRGKDKYSSVSRRGGEVYGDGEGGGEHGEEGHGAAVKD